MVHMAPIERDQVFQLRLSEPERKTLQLLADQAGVTASDWIRLRIREAESTLDKATKKPKK